MRKKERKKERMSEKGGGGVDMGPLKKEYVSIFVGYVAKKI